MHSRPRGELVPLISDGSSLMVGNCMWRHTPLTRGKLPPVTQDWCRKLTQQTFLWAEMKEVPGSPAFLIGHTFLCHSNNGAIAGMALWPQTQNAYFLNHPLSVHLGTAVDWELDNGRQLNGLFIRNKTREKRSWTSKNTLPVPNQTWMVQKVCYDPPLFIKHSPAEEKTIFHVIKYFLL